MDDKKLSRREREKLWQRLQMLDAAMELFSEKGFHNVSMHEIAERSEFAIGTLYKFFKNKEDLYRALVMEKSTEIFNALSAPLSEDGDTRTVLESYLENRSKISAEIAPLLRLHMALAQGWAEAFGEPRLDPKKSAPRVGSDDDGGGPRWTGSVNLHLCRERSGAVSSRQKRARCSRPLSTRRFGRVRRPVGQCFLRQVP